MPMQALFNWFYGSCSSGSLHPLWSLQSPISYIVLPCLQRMRPDGDLQLVSCIMSGSENLYQLPSIKTKSSLVMRNQSMNIVEIWLGIILLIFFKMYFVFGSLTGLWVISLWFLAFQTVWDLRLLLWCGSQV